MTTFAANHARYLDPPDPPKHDTCKLCHEETAWDDLDDYGYCPECSEMMEEAEE